MHPRLADEMRQQLRHLVPAMILRLRERGGAVVEGFKGISTPLWVKGGRTISLGRVKAGVVGRDRGRDGAGMGPGWGRDGVG